MVQQLQAALLYMGSTGTTSSWLLKEKAYLIKPGLDVACCLAICHYSVTSYTMVQATSETNRTKKYKNWINTSNRNTQIHKLVHTNTVCIKCVWNIPMFNNLCLYTYMHVLQHYWNKFSESLSQTEKKYIKIHKMKHTAKSQFQPTPNYTIQCLEWGVEGCRGDVRKKSPLP